MPSLRNYHILISHSWDYNSHYETISGWLNATPYFSWTDYSVPITRPLTVSGVNDLKQKIRNRISLCSCVIILSGMYVAYSINAALFWRRNAGVKWRRAGIIWQRSRKEASKQPRYFVKGAEVV